MKAAIFMAVAVSFLLFDCSDSVNTEKQCVQGKYIGNYCEGAVIQLTDNKEIGKTWKSMYTNQIYQNCVIASFDTTVFEGATGSLFVQKDSLLYFQYRAGGYPRKQYNICEPSPFITITSLSINPCL